MIVAINQPYFSPYAGYYALIRAADVFVLFDCVQFPRRGRVHRSEIQTSQKFSQGWLTLPLQKQAQETNIRNIRMPPWGKEFLDGRYKALIKKLEKEQDISPYCKESSPLMDFLIAHHQTALRNLGINTGIIRSSTLGLPDTLHGQDRIIAICRKLKAKTYINLPGGRSLYNAPEFEKENIKLRFLDTAHCGRFGYLQAREEGLFQNFTEESKDIRFAD